MLLDKKLAKIILYNGKLYVPARDHYPELQNPIVKCDYCGKSGLNISIGHELTPDNKFDICLKCASIVEQNTNFPTSTNGKEILTRMMQDSVRTDMMQDSVRIDMRFNK